MGHITVTVFALGFVAAFLNTCHAKEQLLVLFKRGAQESEVRQTISADSIHIKSRSVLGDRLLLTIEASNSTTGAALIHHPSIERVEPNAKMSIVKPVRLQPEEVKIQRLSLNTQPENGVLKGADICTEEPLVDDMRNWGLIRTSYHANPDYDTAAYRYSNTGSDVDIYIVDSGIDIDNFDVAGRASHGFVSSNFKYTEGEKDYSGHGTNVASLAGGTDYGIANEANLIAVKVLGADGTGTYGDMIEGLNFVIQRARSERSQGYKPRVVINMSLGGSVYSQIMYDTIEEAVQEGLIVVAAAGNDAIDAREHYPSSFDHVISVGASGADDVMADFSNYGSAVDICAPGVDVFGGYSTYAAGCAAIQPYYCAAYVSGTSQAAPHVTGVIARYLQQLSDYELLNVYFEGIREMLIDTATDDTMTYSFYGQRSTPNRLLYKNCGSTDFDVPEPCKNCRDYEDDEESEDPEDSEDSGVANTSPIWLIILVNIMMIANR